MNQFSFNKFKKKEGSTHSSNPSLHFFIHLVLMLWGYVLAIYQVLISKFCAFSFVSEAEVFHGMEGCKAGEATGSRFWKPYQEYKSDLFPTLKGRVMFWSLSIRTSCKMFFPHKVWFNINIRQKASCTKAPLLIKKMVQKPRYHFEDAANKFNLWSCFL